MCIYKSFKKRIVQQFKTNPELIKIKIIGLEKKCNVTKRYTIKKSTQKFGCFFHS